MTVNGIFFYFKLRDLIFFVTIIAIFVCCFGITTQAILYNQNKIDFELFYNIIHKGYWPIYGEMKILEDDIEKFKTCNSTNSDNCPRRMGAIFSLIALIVYMVIANILLLNLLIAMFRLGLCLLCNVFVNINTKFK